jgi:endoglycosylceramidase
MRRRSTMAASMVCLLALLLGTLGPGVRRAFGEARGSGQHAEAPYPDLPVRHAGRWLTDAAGRVLLPHGVNMVSKTAPYYPAAFGFGKADVSWIEANGFNVVRLGVLATGLMPSPGHIDRSYISHLARTVDRLGRHHILVLLDFHQDGYGPLVGSDGFPGWMTITNGAPNIPEPFPLYYLANPALQQAFQSFWNDQRGADGVALQRDYTEMASALAKRFARDPWVLGYDVMNEPWPGTTWGPCLSPSGCPGLDASELAPFYARADHAIRSADNDHLVFVEPFVLFNFGQSPTTVPLAGQDGDSGLSFHQYATSAGAAQGVIDHALAWSASTGGGLLDTEWGATNDPTAITAQADQLDAALLPWIYWSFDGYVVSDLSLPPSGTNLNQGVADALARPHPLVVAGTPLSFSYDPTTRTMRFSYSTARVGGGRFGDRALTSIEVPRLAEPGGYEASISGGTVTSDPNAYLMTVRADRHASSVSVTIVPHP